MNGSAHCHGYPIQLLGQCWTNAVKQLVTYTLLSYSCWQASFTHSHGGLLFYTFKVICLAFTWPLTRRLDKRSNLGFRSFPGILQHGRENWTTDLRISRRPALQHVPNIETSMTAPLSGPVTIINLLQIFVAPSKQSASPPHWRNKSLWCPFVYVLDKYLKRQVNESSLGYLFQHTTLNCDVNPVQHLHVNHHSGKLPWRI